MLGLVKAVKGVKEGYGERQEGRIISREVEAEPSQAKREPPHCVSSDLNLLASVITLGGDCGRDEAVIGVKVPI